MVGDVDINFRVGFFSGPSFDSMLDLVAPLTIRLYAYAAEESAGTFRLGIDTNSFGSNQPDNLVVSGDLSQVADAVPEPTSLVLLGSALAGVAVRRRRRRDR
jgi:hypothetical protein